jgi:hypothetical protein
VSLVRGNPKGLQAKSSPECGEPEVAAMLGDAGFMEDDQFHETEIGSPQGGDLSPLLANLYLNHFDWGMKERGFAVVRYADDGAPRRRGA